MKGDKVRMRDVRDPRICDDCGGAEEDHIPAARAFFDGQWHERRAACFCKLLCGCKKYLSKNHRG
jgi:hypothetical protein